MRIPFLAVILVAALSSASSCASQSLTPDLGPATFHIQVTSVNGSPMLPTADNPLIPGAGGALETWGFTIEARSPLGVLQDFNGFIRLSVRPGTVAAVGDGSTGRNVLLTHGTATGTVTLSGIYGPARLWAEDLGYLPAKPGTMPACANGVDDNHNGLIDYPSDPGCYYADDDTEEGGTYAAGVSPAVEYALPRISDVRGADGARTPFPNESVEIKAGSPQQLIVTRVASDGFYVTDINATEMKNGKNSLYAYNFATPSNMRVCDQITELSGTANDFYGFTELSFPSWKNTYTVLDADAGTPDAGLAGCLVPEPTVLAASLFTGVKDTTSKNLFPYESSLVRIVGYRIAGHIGPNLALNNNFAKNTSNCDFNGDGVIDFRQIAPNCPPGMCEGDCSTLCDADPDCSLWSDFSARNELKLALPGNKSAMIKINAGSVGTFDPLASAGQTIDMVSGTLREFSGGNLNWTIETRCTDDLVCPAAMGCTTQVPIPSTVACIRARTTDDNDQGTN